MNRWRNKVAVVTGGSAGVGAACVVDLAKAGMIVAALSRREETMNKFLNSLPEELRNNVYPIKCDVTIEENVKTAFQWVQKNLGAVHVLINNAGTCNSIDLSGLYCTKEIQETVDINVTAMVFCVREAFNLMKDHQIDGHIVLMNSICGHYIQKFPLCSVNIYAATKYAVTAMVETYSQEFSAAGTNVKVTGISPGIVNSGVMPASLRNLVDLPMLKPENISNAIMYCLSTPPNVQIHDMQIRPLNEKF
ncbi:DHRS11.2 family protein [Megaselia abdita]